MQDIRPYFQAIRLKPASAIPLYRQLYEDLRQAILDKRLTAGAKLPSSRQMADTLGIARNTVLAVFEQLGAEGYVESREGSGTFVAASLPDRLLQSKQAKTPEPESAEPPPVSRRGELLRSVDLAYCGNEGVLRTFRTGTPALHDFPHALWGRLVSRQLRNPPVGFLGYNDSAGYAPLRKAIATYLKASRGVRCDWRQVIIVNGAQQGLDLAVKLLLDPGDTAWMEDPGYGGTRSALVAAGAQVVSVPVDDEGLMLDEGIARGPKVKLIYVTPSHQYPLGWTMSLTRRLALLEWARKAQAWILEDDYDGEFRYRSRPLGSLQGLTDANNVIYLGTFSKVMFPALRIAYAVVPGAVADLFARAKGVTDRYTAAIEQIALAEFIEEGHFGRHLRRMRTLYEERQEAMVEAGRRYLGDALTLRQHDAGLHLTGWLPPGSSDRTVKARLAQNGIETTALSKLSVNVQTPPGLMLGYAPFDEKQIRAGIRKIASLLE